MTQENVDPSKAASQRARKILDADHDNKQRLYESGVNRLTERQAEVVAYREMGFSVPGTAEKMDISKGKVEDELDEAAQKRAGVLIEVGNGDGIPRERAYIVAYSELGYEYFKIASRFNRMEDLEKYGKDNLVEEARDEIEELSDNFDGVMIASLSDEVAEDDTPFLTRRL
jgi:hypothetical protein